jgi:hypothetical protein
MPAAWMPKFCRGSRQTQRLELDGEFPLRGTEDGEHSNGTTEVKQATRSAWAFGYSDKSLHRASIAVSYSSIFLRRDACVRRHRALVHRLREHSDAGEARLRLWAGLAEQADGEAHRRQAVACVVMGRDEGAGFALLNAIHA